MLLRLRGTLDMPLRAGSQRRFYEWSRQAPLFHTAKMLDKRALLRTVPLITKGQTSAQPGNKRSPAHA